jgi:hypothetical protein
MRMSIFHGGPRMSRPKVELTTDDTDNTNGKGIDFWFIRDIRVIRGFWNSLGDEFLL